MWAGSDRGGFDLGATDGLDLLDQKSEAQRTADEEGPAQ